MRRSAVNLALDDALSELPRTQRPYDATLGQLALPVVVPPTCRCTTLLPGQPRRVVLPQTWRSRDAMSEAL
ncbi:MULTISPECIES: hypothetical protein [unclassified Kribbella]|uniref:hypothetical protein n=1 Tax=unclassified Kribbella TaxID=2644121 RepID=UPI0030193641